MRHRRARRHGRRAAARGDDERRRLPRSSRSTATRIERRLETALPRRDRADRSTRRSALALEARDARRGALDRRASATPPTCSRSSSRRGIVPDVAHRPDLGARPAQRLRARRALARRGAARCASDDPEEYVDRAHGVDGRPRAARCSSCSERGAVTFDYGNNLRGQALDGGRRRTRSTSPASCRRSSARCSARARARSAGPRSPAIRRTSARTDEAILELFPDDAALHRWIRAGAASACSSRACRRASAGSATASARRPGCAFNELVRTGEVKAPIVIGRDHLDCGSVASPNRETEAMKDGSDAIADWPILNALLNTVERRHLGVASTTAAASASATRSTPAWSIVADGTADAAAAARARAHHRSRHGRHAPRRRRLPGGDRCGPAARPRSAQRDDMTVRRFARPTRRRSSRRCGSRAGPTSAGSRSPTRTPSSSRRSQSRTGRDDHRRILRARSARDVRAPIGRARRLRQFGLRADRRRVHYIFTFQGTECRAMHD